MRKLLLIAILITPTLSASSRCGFSIDATTSVDAAARTDALARIAASLPDLVRDLQCTTITISTFTDQGWFTPLHAYELPAAQHAPCATNLTTAQRVLQPFDAYRELTRQHCAQQRASEDRSNAAARAAILQQVSAALRSITTRKSRCTDLTTHLALLQHLQRANDVDVVITDAQHTCDTKLAAPLPRVTFILLPTNGCHTAPHDVLRRYPGMRYLVPADLGAPWWRGVTR